VDSSFASGAEAAVGRVIGYLAVLGASLMFTAGFFVGRWTAPRSYQSCDHPEFAMPAPTPYVYPVRGVTSIYDGDTMRVTLDLGFDTYRHVNLRLAGLDAPEVTGESKDAGRAVRDWVSRQIGKAKQVTVESTEVDKYGRCLAVVYVDGRSLNDLLVNGGMALAYSGGDRAGTWTASKLASARAWAESH